MAIAIARPDAKNLINRLIAARGLLMPIFSLALIFVILKPLPTWFMDFLLSTNLMIAAVVMLTVMYLARPLEFSSFPSLLLSLTLFRLVLNTATTRLILTNGQDGINAAGKVVATFGTFVAGDSLVVGIIIFAIIVIIQFIVITKGATRIAEVAARFTLDGMPGKQMAIDADLNAGLITEDEAKRRREEITRESDFYGAMDGASKFVRGDAIAGIIITLVNILGGIGVGMLELNMDFKTTVETFTKLTIGDGLVSQIPAFIISIAAAMLVTRSASKAKSMGDELFSQLTSRPVALALAAGFLGMLMITPLPKAPLLLLAGALGTTAFVIRKNEAKAVTEAQTKKKQSATKEPEKIEKFLGVDPMELEVGYGLIQLVDRQKGGDLLDRITNLRKQVATELGIVVPPIRIRDNVQLQPNQYSIKIKGMEIVRSELMPGHVMAIDAGTVTEKIGGTETVEPAFGLPAVWVQADRRHDAEIRNYTVVEPTSVLTTHLGELIKQHADELLTRQEVNRLVDNLRERSPKLVEELIPNSVKPGELQRCLQNLLRERVPIRDLETILETLGDWIGRTRDIDILTEYVRNALARTICQLHRGHNGKVNCITLDPQLEEQIAASLDRSDKGTFFTMPPQMQSLLVDSTRKTVEQAMPGCGGQTPVVLCSPQIRQWVRRLIEPTMPLVAVLSYNEIVRGIEIESHGMVICNEGS